MTFHRWFAGFFLLILMVIALFVNSILFSARSFQDNLAHLAPETGGVVKLADIEDVELRVAEIRSKTQDERGELRLLEEDAAKAKLEVQRLRDSLATLEREANRQTGEIETAVGLTQAASSGAFDTADVAQRLDRISGQRNGSATIRDAVATVRADLAKVPTLEQSLKAAEGDLAAKELARDRAAEFVSTSDRTILGLQSQFGEDFIRVRNEARALVASTPFGLGPRIVEMHPTFLSTILVLIMGALGAILYLFPAYLNRDNRIYFADIVVRLVFGMVVALAFYIVANATLAGFAFVPGGEGSSAGASLNPFSVSLIGIVAGIMADDIAAWILKRGRELFGGGFADAGAARRGGSTVAVGGAPYQDAARDARATTRTAPTSGDSPPKGGVVG